MKYLIKVISVIVGVFGIGFGGAAVGLPEKLQAGLPDEAIWLFLPRFAPFAIVAVIIWYLADLYRSKKSIQSNEPK